MRNYFLTLLLSFFIYDIFGQIVSIEICDTCNSVKVTHNFNGATTFVVLGSSNITASDSLFIIDSFNFYNYNSAVVVADFSKKIEFCIRHKENRMFFYPKNKLRRIKKEQEPAGLYIGSYRAETIILFKDEKEKQDFLKAMKSYKKKRIFNLKPRKEKPSP